MRPPSPTYAEPMVHLLRAWLPASVDNALRAHAEFTGLSLSEVTRDALRAFLSPTKETNR